MEVKILTPNICNPQLPPFQDKKVNIRERLFELEDALLEIKTTTLQKEQNIQTAVEKENTKVVQTVNSQIINLKQAIGTLADAVSEEIETLKKTILQDVEFQIQQNSNRIEQACQVFSKYDNDNSKIIFEVNTLRDEIQTLHAIEGRNMDKIQNQIEERLQGMKNDNKKLFESLRIIIQGNAQQIGTCTKEIERLESQVELLRTSNNNLNDNYSELTKKMLHLDKDTTTQFKQISTDMIDMHSLLKDQEQLNHAFKTQMDQLNRNQELKQQASIQPVTEQLNSLQVKSDTFEKQMKKLKQENEVSY